MRTALRHVLVGVTAVAAVVTAAPAASANPAGDTIHGGCFVDTTQNPVLTNGQNQGVMGDVSVTTDPSRAPTGATVTCYLKVNGVVQFQTEQSYSGTGVQAGAEQIVFPADATDTVLLCEDVTYADGTTEPETCTSVSSQLDEPPIIHQLFVGFVDPTVCPIFSTLSRETGGVIAGAIVIDPTGDLYVAQPIGPGYIEVYDCPPYGP